MNDPMEQLSSLSKNNRTFLDTTNIIKKIWVRTRKQWAHHYIVRAEHQLAYHNENSLWGRNLIKLRLTLEERIERLRSAKEDFGHGDIRGADLKKVRLDLKHIVKAIHQFGNDDRSLFGEWMQDMVVPVYTNNVSGVVYIGAGLLVMIVGLRGLGDLSTWPLIPSWCLNAENRLHENIVLIGLLVELVLLLFLGGVQFFTAGDKADYGKARSGLLVMEENHAKALTDFVTLMKEEGANSLDELVQKRVKTKLKESLQKALED